jgi:alpha-D-ribose 1-methylphosphonate 5-triphosphate diphosphatase
MKKIFCLHGGPLFDGERLLEQGTILFDQRGIMEILEGDFLYGAAEVHDVGGHLMVPGLVDLHSDALEKCIEMRPGVFFDAEFALMNLDRRVAACGITTYCHGISFAQDEFGLRACHEAERLVRMVQAFGRFGGALVRHRVHARYEITGPQGADTVERLLAENLLDMASVMDHTPGQGQFKTLESYITYKLNNYRVTPEEVQSVVELKLAQREEGLQRLRHFAGRVHEAGIPLLSHDDDTAEKVTLVAGLGVTASEFPITREAVQAARQQGMKVFLGAPNFLRDQSSNGHLRASEAVLQGECDGLMSDYYPESLIQVPFLANQRYGIPLADAFALVTSGPGSYLGRQNQVGSLAVGGPADLLIIDCTGPWVKVLETWVGGRCVHRNARELKVAGLKDAVAA